MSPVCHRQYREIQLRLSFPMAWCKLSTLCPFRHASLNTQGIHVLTAGDQIYALTLRNTPTPTRIITLLEYLPLGPQWPDCNVTFKNIESSTYHFCLNFNFSIHPRTAYYNGRSESIHTKWSRY